MVFPLFSYVVISIYSLSNADDALSNNALSSRTGVLKKGVCLTREKMIQRLSFEKQYPLLIQDIIGFNSRTGERILKREVFTSDTQQKNGLHLEVDAKGDYCVGGELSNIKLFNSLSGNFDPKAYTEPSSFKAPGTLNKSLDAGFSSKSFVPLLQATSISSGNIITAIGAPEGSRLGAVFFSSSKGYLNPDSRYDVTNVTYSAVAKETLLKR